MSPLSPQEFASEVALQAKLEPYHASRIASRIEHPGTMSLIPVRPDSLIAQIPTVVYAMEHGEYSAGPDVLRAQVTAQIESLFSEDWKLQTLGKHVFRYVELLEKFVSKDRLKKWLEAYVDRISENGQYGGSNTFRYFAALNLDRIRHFFADDPDFIRKLSVFLGNDFWVPSHAVLSGSAHPEEMRSPRDLSADASVIVPNVRTARGVTRAATTCSPQAETYHGWTSLNTDDLHAEDRKYIAVEDRLIGSMKWGDTRETKQHSFLSFRTVHDEATDSYPLIENALYLASSDVLRKIPETAGNVVQLSAEDDVAFMPQRSMQDSAIGNTNYLQRVRTVRSIVEQEFGFST